MTDYHKCTECKGLGTVPDPADSDNVVNCRFCDGTGLVPDSEPEYNPEDYE